MPVRFLAVLAVLAVLASLGACALPRPMLTPAIVEACPEQPVAGQPLLLVSFRLPDCGKGAIKWSNYRSEAAHFGVADAPRSTWKVRESDWWSELRARVSRSGNDPVIFIHGYYNSQDDAVDRGLAIRTLLCRHHARLEDLAACDPARPVVALSWPSLDRFAKYVWDETNSEWAADPAVDVILRIAREYPRTILIAHSMGNRILIPAALAARGAKLSLHHLVLASADVDRAYFARLLRRPDGLGFPATVYASREDRALKVSWRFHGYPRAGDLSNRVSGGEPGYPYEEFHNTEIIDTTAADADLAGHVAFLKSAEGAADLCHVLAGDEVKPGRVKEGGYWLLTEGVAPDDDCGSRASAAVTIAQGKPASRP